jgi:hypothetical protein
LPFHFRRKNYAENKERVCWWYLLTEHSLEGSVVVFTVLAGDDEWPILGIRRKVNPVGGGWFQTGLRNLMVECKRCCACRRSIQ